MNKMKLSTLVLAAAVVASPIGTIPAFAAGIQPDGPLCPEGWSYGSNTNNFSGQWTKYSEGTHYINQTGSAMTYTSQVSTAVTAGYTLSGSAQGGFGPINATLGFQANASITITTSDSTTITIPNLYEGWNEYGVKRDNNTGWYSYVNSNCTESSGHWVTVDTPRVKAVVGRTKYFGSM